MKKIGKKQPAISGVDSETEASDATDSDAAIIDSLAEAAKRGVVSEGTSFTFLPWASLLQMGQKALRVVSQWSTHGT
jgi:hypothetical protein